MHLRRTLRFILLYTLAALVTAVWVPNRTQARSADSSKNRLTPRVLPLKPVSTTVADDAASGYVVVKFHDGYQVRLRRQQLVSKSGHSIAEAERELATYLPNKINRLMATIPEQKLERDRELLQSASGRALADMNSYYRLAVATPAEAENLINNLNRLREVELAYYQPLPEPAGDIDPPTPDYTGSQLYRNAAPAGVDAVFANTQPGGDGTGVKIVDIEGNWQTTHEDLDKAVGGIITPTVINDLSWRNHGTAVLGEMIGGDNGYGVTGICPGADVGMVSIASISTAEALYTAIDNLQPGDLILIELHAPGPHFNFQSRDDQLGYVAMEYWQANFDAIQYAWARGITVCEAAGNGAENYDDLAIYGQLFDTTYRNSHAILVGAGWPASSFNDRIRHGFSNYGERVNLQGYGSSVTTTGYGGLFAPNGDENQFYTSTFSGTSSASPIITGSVACLQGHFKATYGTYMTSDMIRTLLVATGSPQLGDTTEHIGPRPDLQAAFASMTAPPSLYALPIYIDTSLADTQTVTIPVWLFNRSAMTALDFAIVGDDSLAKPAVPNWLDASPASGTIPAADSVQIDVTLDATLLGQSINQFKGMLVVSWNQSGMSLDSNVFVPVYLDVPCADDSYFSVASSDSGGPAYNWVAADVVGTRVPDGDFFNSFGGNPLDDGTTLRQQIGFSFPFYDTTYTEVSIAVNGALSFSDTEVNVNGFYSGLTIPGAPFSTFVAPFYADLIINTGSDPSAGVYLYRSPTNDSLVIEWHRIANFNAPGSLSDFEVILTASGKLTCQYQDIESSGLAASALIGIQEIDCRALQYFGGGEPPAHQPSNGTAVLFYPNLPPCCVGMTGNADCDNQDLVDIADLTRLIDFLFLSHDPLCCVEEADIDGTPGVDIGDLTRLIDFLFISNTLLPICP